MTIQCLRWIKDWNRHVTRRVYERSPGRETSRLQLSPSCRPYHDVARDTPAHVTGRVELKRLTTAGLGEGATHWKLSTAPDGSARWCGQLEKSFEVAQQSHFLLFTPEDKLTQIPVRKGLW